MSLSTKLIPLALASIALSINVHADSFGIALGKHGQHGSFAFQWSHGIHAPVPAPACAPIVWKPGHCQTVYEKVWIAGSEQKVWVAPIYEVVYDQCGHPHQVCVRAGWWKSVCTPGHFETRPVETCSQGWWQTPGCGY